MSAVIITINVNVMSLCDIRCESEYRFSMIIFSIYIQLSIQNVKKIQNVFRKILIFKFKILYVYIYIYIYI